MSSAAEQTRQNILEVTADEIHKNGFTATSLSVILKRCEISKGALYHHFANKLELGYAVFEEMYTPMFLATWQPALDVEDPIEGLCAFFTSMSNELSCDELVCGCPLNNLCHEMSSTDEGFRLRILNLQKLLNQMISSALTKYQDSLRDELNFSQVSYFIVATFYGASDLTKTTQNKALFEQIISELCHYIRALKK
mgnify:CR=1 FL=1